MDAEQIRLRDWQPLRRAGCVGVDHKALLQHPNVVIVMLRFGLRSTIDEHAAGHSVDVICLEGAGMFSIDGTAHELMVGHRVQWPAQRPHRLWTEHSPMVTLVVEHLGS